MISDTDSLRDSKQHKLLQALTVCFIERLSARVSNPFNKTEVEILINDAVLSCAISGARLNEVLSRLTRCATVMPGVVNYDTEIFNIRVCRLVRHAANSFDE